jgi:hypothetical protein
MKNFGKLKNKMLMKLIESFSKNEKDEMKDILGLLKENKDFKELYLLYDEIEDKTFDDKEMAESYVNELSSVLKNKSIDVEGLYETLEKRFKEDDVDLYESNIHSMLDSLLENDNILNIDKKVTAKKGLIDHLLSKKSKKEEPKIFTENENMLHAVLTNNFNSQYSNLLNEEDKNELKGILLMSEKEIELETKNLKESINTKISELLNESKVDSEMVKKLNQVKDEVNGTTSSKYNYFKLKQLKNGL